VSETFPGFDGAALALHRMGEGRPVVLLHGLFSSAQVNWIKFGTAAQLAAAGFECLMPDLRAHGKSAAPHDPAAYPADVLVRDLDALVAHLGLVDYDLVGFSLGSRTSARAVIAGARPRRLVLAGMGLEGLAGWARRQDFFLDMLVPMRYAVFSTKAALARAFNGLVYSVAMYRMTSAAYYLFINLYLFLYLSFSLFHLIESP
jgi:pimeloyl-ACP methyl ester carboxylesterase